MTTTVPSPVTSHDLWWGLIPGVPTGTDPALSWLRLRVFSVLRTVDKLKHFAGTGIRDGMGVWINNVTPEHMAARFHEISANT